MTHFRLKQTYLYVFSRVYANYYFHPIDPNFPMNVDHCDHYPVVLPVVLLLSVFLVAKLHLKVVRLNVVVMDDHYQFVDYFKNEKIIILNTFLK